MARVSGLELASGQVGRLGPITIHGRQPVARIGLAQAAVDTPPAAGDVALVPEMPLGHIASAGQPAL